MFKILYKKSISDLIMMKTIKKYLRIYELNYFYQKYYLLILFINIIKI